MADLNRWRVMVVEGDEKISKKKVCNGRGYNYFFDYDSGFFARWGITKKDDPAFSPIGPEILDIEVSEICSPAGTKVNTPHGEKNIEDIRIGDFVIGWDAKSGHIRVNDVKELFTREYEGDIIYIELESGDILPLTPEHPVFLVDGRQVKAGELKEDDEIISFEMRIKSIEKKNFSGRVYNFHSSPDRNYFSHHVLVHNCHGISRTQEIDDSSSGGEFIRSNPSPCEFCYKSNTAKGENMSLETFKKIIDNVKGNVMQVALGIGDIDGNPELFELMKYCRENDIVPNITINGDRLEYDLMKKLNEFCGAVAVSRYNPKDICYEAVHELTGLGMKQVNIHMLVADETYEDCLEVLDDAKNDYRLKDLNAIVFLMLKQKGTRNHFNPLDTDRYRKIVKKALDLGVRIGMDSCSGPKFLECVKGRDDYEQMYECVEPCESCLFSLYINAKGRAYPCSFCEGEEDFGDGIDIVDCKNFVNDVWYGEMARDFRVRLLKTEDTNICRTCPVFNLNGIEDDGFRKLVFREEDEV